MLTIVCVAFSQTREEARKNIIDDITMSKKSLPFTESFLTITNIEVKGNDLFTYYFVDDRAIDFNAYVRNMKSNKKTTFLQTARNRPRYAYNLVVARLNMAVVIKAKYSGKSETIIWTADELKNILLEEARNN